MTAAAPSSSTASPPSTPSWSLEEVAPGLLRLDTPLPFRGLKQVNLWLIHGAEGWTMVDCGFGSPEHRQMLEEAWRAALGGRALTRLVVTHFHPDHLGNAGFIARRWGLTPEMTQLEWLAAHVAWHDGYSDDITASTGFFRRHGLGEAHVETYRQGFLRYGASVDLPPAYRRIADGDVLRLGDDDWQVITGAGHSPDLATLHNLRRGLYISGDQVLPAITPNVSVYPGEPDADPIAAYVAALARIRSRVDDAVLVLPSHKRPFQGLHGRLDALGRHHEERLAHLLGAFPADGHAISAAEGMAHLFPFALDGHQVSFAMGETLAHLNHLRRRGAVEEISAGDRLFYRLTSPARNPSP
ncbi:MBL fold metallo-hydrolase [Xanthobacter sp. V4C-4]|uniref:MBL fold metallo-hydrolase n=1 Tax=Xanthobacter cornucopiae TaxID=3119924 RepID=UPI00372CCDF8